jgi:DNA primase
VSRFLAEDVDARIASLPEGEDPDSLARRGQDAVAECLRGAVPAVDFALTALLEHNDRTIPGRVRTLTEAAPLLTAIRNPSARDLYAGKLAAALDLEVAHVHRALRGAAPQPEQIRSRPEPATLPPTEGQLLSLVADHPGLAPRVAEAGVLGLIEHDGVRRLLGRMLEITRDGRLDVAAIIDDAPEELREEVARELMSSSFAACPDPERALDECVAGLRGRNLERRAAALRHESKQAEETGDRARARELAMQAMELDRERRSAAGAAENQGRASQPAPPVVNHWNVR